ncbi:MAG: hypothetical protein AABY64_02290 [Bdellovibrionota bacterium]
MSQSNSQQPFPISLKIIISIGLLIGAALYIYGFKTVLNGPHQYRQADSAFVGYFFCTENTDFFHPHIAPRGLTEGTGINEFPIYGAVLGGICRIKGSWDEATPRLVSLFFAIASAVLFWGILKRKYNLDRVTWIEYLVLFIFLPVNWTFFTIPMPDSTGLFLYALAGYIWSAIPLKDHSRAKQLALKILGSIIFMLGFLVRPYYILILFFYFPGLLTTAITLVLCIGLFWFWYRYWSTAVSVNPTYFGIQFQTSKEVLASLPNALAHLPTRIFEHTALIGFWAFAICWKKYRWIVLFYIANIGMMYVLKSTHIADHGYYLLNAGLFATFALILGYQELNTKQRSFFLSFFLLYTFAFTQHNFHRNKNYDMTIEAASKVDLPANAIVATYLTDPQWLYYLKRIGYISPPEFFNGTCPPGATHYLIHDPENKTQLKMDVCK